MMSSSRSGRFRGLVPLSVAVTAALTLGACSSGGENTPADDDGGCARTSTSAAAGVRPISISPAAVTVLAPGDGERRVPAPEPDLQSPQQVQLSTESTEVSVAPGSDQEQADPENGGVQNTVESLTVPLTARAGCENTDDLEMTLGSPQSPDEALQPGLPAMDGTRSGVTYRDGLNPTSLRILPADGSEAPAQRAVEQSLVNAFTHAVPLPTTAVGLGAHWRATRTVSSAITVAQTIDVVLKRWTGRVLTLEVKVDESPADSTFRIPGSTETLQVSRFANAGSGTLTVDLGRLLPTGGELTMAGARELVGADPGRPILQRTGFTMSWKTAS
ncbi:hypothetical protein [Gordonia sp. VNK21]|uniref:hypothetical protein n=1 Tax=Gordonia sp. VNK21 TaxID=3382483 RepID=UPI0038D463E8